MSVSPPPTVEDEPLEFDPFGPTFFGDPTEVYRRLRNEAPVYLSEKYGFWALSRWVDVAAAHKDYAACSSSYGTDLHLLSDPEKIAPPASPWASVTACTAASVPRWPAWRAGSPSPRWLGAGPATTSSKTGCTG